MMRIERQGIVMELEQDGSFGIGVGALWFEQRCRGFAAQEMCLQENGMSYRLVRTDGVALNAALEIVEGGVELTLTGDARFDALEYPGGTRVLPGDVALLPIGGGFAFPVDDPAVRVLPEDARTWSVSQCMGMIGLTRGDGWLVTALEDASDAEVCRRRDENGMLRPYLRLLPELGKLAYARKLRFLVGTQGGLTAACLAYRAYRQAQGLVVTLKQKRERIPGVDKLLGAADVWLWHDRYEEAMYSTSTEEFDLRNQDAVLSVAREMHANGLKNAVFGMFFRDDCQASGELRKMGYLVSKYDNYTDLLPGEVAPLIPKFRIEQCDYTLRRTKNWPQDVRITEDGGMCGAWALRGVDGKMHPQNSMCARQADLAAREEVGALAREYGCNAWFIDVIGGGLQECFHPEHPMTHRQSRKYILDTLRSMTDESLVSGTEEGVEFCVPELCYAEGRMSPQQYRINWLESGRQKAHQYAPEEHEDVFDRFMLNPAYRAPLWELVYHDCTVSYWYWGDSSNCCPERMPQRDLFNLLYGTPPLYSFHTGDWPRLREQVLESQKRVCPVARRVGLEAMTDFAYCTPDKLVQRTRFSNGTEITVNFSHEPYRMADGVQLAPGDYRVEG